MGERTRSGVDSRFRGSDGKDDVAVPCPYRRSRESGNLPWLPGRGRGLVLADDQVGEDAGGQDADGGLDDDQGSAAPGAGSDSSQRVSDAGYGVAYHRDGGLFQGEAGGLKARSADRS